MFRKYNNIEEGNQSDQEQSYDECKRTTIYYTSVETLDNITFDEIDGLASKAF